MANLVLKAVDADRVPEYRNKLVAFNEDVQEVSSKLKAYAQAVENMESLGARIGSVRKELDPLVENFARIAAAADEFFAKGSQQMYDTWRADQA